MYKENLRFFIANGLLDNIDYYFIINGDCTVSIPTRSNIQIIYRENKGFDFGSYSCAVKQIINKYDYYVFMNTSVRGPFLIDGSKPWIDYFIELFNTDDIKIVGTSINIFPISRFDGNNLDEIYGHPPPHTHVQSMFFCIDNEYYEYLKSKNFFIEETMNDITTIDKIIIYKEFGLSQLALNNGWNINCILSHYKDIDYREIKEDFNSTSYYGDPYYPNRYFGKSIDPFQVIFYKISRMNLDE
jgi:lipopolysaccharide biosynthesis protein